MNKLINKKSILTRNLYGVDVPPELIEIVLRRMFTCSFTYQDIFLLVQNELSSKYFLLATNTNTCKYLQNKDFPVLINSVFAKQLTDRFIQKMARHNFIKYYSVKKKFWDINLYAILTDYNNIIPSYLKRNKVR